MGVHMGAPYNPDEACGTSGHPSALQFVFFFFFYLFLCTQTMQRVSVDTLCIGNSFLLCRDGRGDPCATTDSPFPPC